MKIPEELQKKWQGLRSHGDGRKISEANEGISEFAVSRALVNGECQDHVFEAIAKYYKEKEENIKDYL